MKGPISLDELARLAHVAPREIESFRNAGLLDLDRDALYDDWDVLRLACIELFLDEGKTLGEIAQGVSDGTLDVPFFGDILFGRGALFGERAVATLEDAAQRVGLSVEQIQELRTAAGLPGSAVMQERDVEVIAGVKVILDAGLPWKAVIDVTRVYGDALRRIAEAEVRMMHEHVHLRMASEGTEEREIARHAHPLLEAMTHVVDPTLQYIHHQHLLRRVMEDIIGHLGTDAGPAGGAFEATILFVDLTSYTSLAQIHGDEVAAEVLDRFDGLVRSLVHGHQGTLVKQIGDAFMLTFADPTDAVRFAVALDDSAAREEHFPALRIGIHTGPVLYRVGDYVGNTVNIASRISAAAMPNQIVVTEPVAKAAEATGFTVMQAGVRMLRGIEDPIELYRVSRGQEAAMQDPVCGMRVIENAAARLTWDGIDYVFCSEDCLRRFVAEPAKYVLAREG